MKRIRAALLVILLICTFAACSGQPASDPENTQETGREPYKPMDIFSEEFCPCGSDWSGNYTVFEAYFDKSATEGKSRFILCPCA